MSGDNGNNGECCEVPVCLIITSVVVTEAAKEGFKELFEGLCGENGNGNGDNGDDDD